MDLSPFALDQLPFDCLYCICEYLSSEDLSRFSRTCTLFHNVASAESLWRKQSLSRWQFCDVREISSGERRWWRYFQARRKLEAGMERGRSGRDYRFKSLRAHEQDIINVVTLEGSSVDWEHPAPPTIVSISQDGVLHAWDVKDGNPVFSLERKNITCLDGNQCDEIAVGDSDGHVTIYGTANWSVKRRLVVPVEEKITILSLQYGKINHGRGQHQSLLMVHAWGVDSSDAFIVVWDIANPARPPSLLSLDLMPFEESALVLNLSSSGWLAASPATTDSVYVWLLSDIISSSPPPPPPPAQAASPPSPSPSSPLVTLHLENMSTPPYIWLRPGVLATCSLDQTIRRHHNPPHLPHHFAHRGHHTSTMNIWDVAKFADEQRKGQSFQDGHLYDSKSVNLDSLPTVVAYCHGVLVTGDKEGFMRIIDPVSGQVISKFKDHLGPVTDLYADRFRVLSCSKDYSVRVYRWKWEERESRSRPQLESRYQLLGGSVAHKNHDGFCQVTCTATCCVGVAGSVIKLYDFARYISLPDAQK